MNQKVLITAGASGIGREIALAFATSGARICVCDIDSAALDALTHEIRNVTTTVCDLSSPSEIEKMVAFAANSLGGLDVLINNAGIAGPTLPVEELSSQDWERVVQVNLNGTFNVTRLSIPHLKKSPSGVIIIMSSIAGSFGYPNRSSYATTKWGLTGFTKTLSRELGEFDIRVNAIAPGAVEGPRMQQVLQARARLSGRTVEQERQLALSLQSLKRFVDPEDIGALAVFLASNAAKSISGQMLRIDNDRQQA